MNAVSRAAAESNIGSTAMSGVATMRATVSALGRFTLASGERLQYQFTNSAQRLEHAVTRHRNGLEIRRTLDPLAGRQLFDQVLAGVSRIGRGPHLRGIGDFPSRIQRGLQLLDGRRVRQVPFV